MKGMNMDTKTLTIQSLKKLEGCVGYTAYAILQLKKGDAFYYKGFEGYDRTVNKYGRINLEDYDLKGAFQLKEDKPPLRMLERIFEIWNSGPRPIRDGFPGHSLSVSDVVALYQGDGIRFYFCDRIGFKELDNEFTQSGLI